MSNSKTNTPIPHVAYYFLIDQYPEQVVSVRCCWETRELGGEISQDGIQEETSPTGSIINFQP